MCVNYEGKLSKRLNVVIMCYFFGLGGFFFPLRNISMTPCHIKAFVEMKLRNVRRNLEEGQRRYQKRRTPCRVASPAQLSEDEDPSDVKQNA